MHFFVRLNSRRPGLCYLSPSELHTIPPREKDPLDPSAEKGYNEEGVYMQCLESKHHAESTMQKTQCSRRSRFHTPAFKCQLPEFTLPSVNALFMANTLFLGFILDSICDINKLADPYVHIKWYRKKALWIWLKMIFEKNGGAIVSCRHLCKFPLLGWHYRGIYYLSLQSGMGRLGGAFS